MQRMIKSFFLFILCQFFLVSSVYSGDETEIFTITVDPDVLIVLDASGSMGWDPAGNFCYDPGCTRLEIAKEAIRQILDDTKNGVIDSQDDASLKIRFGFMRFVDCYPYDGPYEGSDYNSGCNIIRNPIGTPYSTIYGTVQLEYSNAGTPLAGALAEAKLYLDYHKTTDEAKDCRPKFVILITDGSDTYSCGGDGRECLNAIDTVSNRYQARRQVVATIKALADVGYKVFVIGFGANMPGYLKNTLNWAAYYGKTDNPMEPNVGDTSAYNPALVSPCQVEDPSSLIEGTCREGGIDYPMPFYAPSNDPGNTNLSGYAFLATTAAELNNALRNAVNAILESRYSFSIPSVSAARLQDENFLYEASFYPSSEDPFWQGHLKKYQIDSAGKVTSLWDAGDYLRNKTASSRNMYTFLGGTIKTFTTANITPSLLGLSFFDYTGRDKVVGYFRGETAYNKENWKLGDIFHSNPITIGPPPAFYNDFRSPAAYETHRANYKTRERLLVMGANDGQLHAFSASTGEEKWSFIPPNLLSKLKLVSHSTEPAPSPDHQFFVDGPVTVSEVWLGSGDGLNKNANDWKTLLILGLGKGVRGSTSYSDPLYLWSSSPSCDSGLSRKYYPPHQYYCGYYAFDVTNTSANPPQIMTPNGYLWRIKVASSSHGRYLDEPWSKMTIGRVKIDGNEKWVGFIGGGYNVNTYYDDDDVDTWGRRGKGFFVVELSSGEILWSFTNDNDHDMDYCIPASAAAVDWDSDGFVDTVYIGDLGGNIWRFRFCSSKDSQPCGTGNWKGNRLFASSTGIIRPIFTRPAVASDQANQLWVFWGTGNKVFPTDSASQERFFALQETFVPVKSATSAPTYNINDLENLTPPSGTYQGKKPGWYINLTGGGEKMLSDPAVFGGMVLFTTYSPYSGTNPCLKSGTGKLYAMAMMPIVIDGVTYNPGKGLWAGGERSISLGTTLAPGIPMTPTVSQKPRESPGPTDIFVTVSGGGGVDAGIKTIAELVPGSCPVCERLRATVPQAQITHWRDMRMQ